METIARHSIRRQKGHDKPRGTGPGLLATRYRAVVDAKEARERGEVGAEYAVRQALVDLASCCELMAERLPAPRRP